MKLSLWFLLVGILTAGCDTGRPPQNIEKVAPEFKLTDGVQSVDLEQFRGKVVLLNFWASTCAPCVLELPSLLDLHRRMPDIVVLGVSIDDNDDAYRKFLIRHHVNFLTARDDQQRVNRLYGTLLIPETYLIDRNGVIRRKFVNAQDWTNPEIMTFLKTL